MAHVLEVSTNGELVGRVTFEGEDDRYSFDYEEAWRAHRGAFSLSPHIPVDGPVRAPGTVHRFIENLLPEGRALDVAIRFYHVSRNNTYGLIRLLGKEPAGALSFFVDDGDDTVEPARPPEALEPVRREISNEELAERIATRNAVPFAVWDGQVRLSVAGQQDKLQVLVEGDRISLVEGALSSTHILKPESLNTRTPFMVANEHFCMTLAARIGLPVAPCSIRRIPTPILLVERFDRGVIHDPNDPERAATVRRKHIIDGCQALDLPSTFKYERYLGNEADVRNIRDGVSYEKLFSLTEHFEKPASAKTYLVRWAILQLLIGNSDAHGKNVSFFVDSAGLTPAPLYDLVCVDAYGNAFVQDMAMGYGEVFRLEEISAFAMADFAHRTGTRPAFLAREMTRMAHAAKNVAHELAASDVYIGDERELTRKIADFVFEQADRIAALAPMIPQVDPKLL
ncbi:HipA domain-containing protein [Paraburkholderia humisilvae]|uniref:Serine/threonine-protein kinase toxin HipA n=1 Tax=Paraburkholderia humisilvae TaxID=627669 RepID=A0A6J5EA28_9BURK|nr:HipA domain-containing protein [Paraburkholderia humisilvae]CAB3763203.1 Serine/threonine-protein kinase toxin HipA [Paraburkholderia humisilvae]